MADAKLASKNSLQTIFSELGDRKLVILGPNNSKLQDSRFIIIDAGVDHIVIKLLGDEHLVIPYSSITDTKIERQSVTIRYR